jgi:hypothetical protein
LFGGFEAATPDKPLLVAVNALRNLQHVSTVVGEQFAVAQDCPKYVCAAATNRFVDRSIPRITAAQSRGGR